MQLSHPLKLIALDRDDLEVMSAHLQDSVVKVGESHWRPDVHRVVIALNRFDWDAAQDVAPSWQRRRSALRSLFGDRNAACVSYQAAADALTKLSARNTRKPNDSG